MREKILAVLLSLAMIGSAANLPVFADNDEVETVDIVEETEVAETEKQTKLIPLIKTVFPDDVPMDEAAQEATVIVDELSVSVMSLNENPVVNSAWSNDFYADTTTFEIDVYIDNMKDTRQKLELAVVDENDVVIAQQKGVYYQQNGLVYQMELVKAVDGNTDYYIQFTYSGKYELEYEIYDASIYPITNVAIKDIEVIDYETNSFRIILANAAVGTTYTLFYQEEWNGATVKKNATVTSDKSLYVEFGDDFALSDYNYIWLCEDGATGFSYSNCIDYKALYNFDLEEADGEVSNSGVSCDSYISTTATNTWFGMYQKGFGYQSYTADDVDNINVYMFDMTTGKTVGTMSDIEYNEAYDQISGYVTFSTKLDETDKYIMVFDDGYSLRVHDDFAIVSEPKLTDVYFYDMNKKYLNALPSGTRTFYAYVSSYNISDRNNIKVELIDSAGKVVATSSYDSKSYYFLMTTTSVLPAGEYTLKATYNNLVYSRTLNVIVGNSTCYQHGRDVTVYNGKTYIGVTLETESLNPENLTYKLVLDDGTEKEPIYYRSLYNDAYQNYKYFVLVIDEELAGINYNNAATLKIYNGSSYIAPDYDNNMRIYSVERATGPFVYDEYKTTNSTVEMFVEGISTAGTFSLCAFDDLTKTGVEVAAASVSNTSVIFNRSNLKKINTIYPLDTGYGVYNNKELFIELNGEYVTFMWGDNNIGNDILDDTFGFQKAYTGRVYEVLNLPHITYEYYKLAASESELSSKFYQKIDTGILYHLQKLEGEETVYAQFKALDGTESAIQTASITIDAVAPSLELLTEFSPSLVIDENDELNVSMNISVNEPGKIHLCFYDKNNNKIGYDRTQSIKSGVNNISMTFWADDYNYEDAVKLVCYATDTAGNKSNELLLDTTVHRQFSEYISSGTYIKINNENGMIVQVDSTGTSIDILTEINGVTVTGIEQYAFNDNGKALKIYIPESVVNISDKAFMGLCEEFTLIVEEDSAAYRFALENDIPYEVIKPLSSTSVSVSLNGQTKTETITANQPSKGTAIIAALYDSNGVMLTMQTERVLENVDFNFSIYENGSYIKLMWWESIGTIKPLGDSKRIDF